MKKLMFFILAIAILLFPGCQRLEDAVEERVDALEATVKQQINDAANALIDSNPALESFIPADPASLLSPEEAQQIALEHAEKTADEVIGLHTVLQIDDGRQEYEVTFRVGHLEYEYEIDAVSGTVLSVDIDD